MQFFPRKKAINAQCSISKSPLIVLNIKPIRIRYQLLKTEPVILQFLKFQLMFYQFSYGLSLNFLLAVSRTIFFLTSSIFNDYCKKYGILSYNSQACLNLLRIYFFKRISNKMELGKTIAHRKKYNKPLGPLIPKVNQSSEDLMAKLKQSEEHEMLKKQISMDLARWTTNIDKIPKDINIEKDEIIMKLIELQKKISQKKFLDIENQINKLIGKRLIILESELVQRRHQENLNNREKMENQYFRHKQIKIYNYQQLISQKLAQNSLILKPYSNGKGFIESDIYENQYDGLYTQKLQECRYIQVAKKVNKILMDNFSYGSVSQIEIFTKISIVLLILIIILSSVATYNNCERQELIYCIFAVVSIMFILIVLVLVKSYINLPSDNNQIEQTFQDIHKYFKELNIKNKQEGKKFEWLLQEHLMYIEVHFEEQLHF